MIYTELVAKAANICAKAHENEVDERGMPAKYHPLHLAVPMETEEETIVAFLHDVAGKPGYSLDDLREMGFPESVINTLSYLIYDGTIPYFEYIARIKEDPVATIVKIKDLKHHWELTKYDAFYDAPELGEMSNLSRPYMSDEEAQARLKRYEHAYKILTGEEYADDIPAYLEDLRADD